MRRRESSLGKMSTCPDPIPRTVYVREDAIVPKLDEWLAQLFEEEHLDQTCKALSMAGQVDEGPGATAIGARRKIADCDQRLSKYRTALDAGADAAVVARWMAEVKGERLRAEHELGIAVPSERLTKEQIRKLVLGLRDIASVLAEADPKLKAEVYVELGVAVTYDQQRRLVSVTAGPKSCTTERVGEGFATITTPAAWRTAWAA
jgi:hypothetical protein